MQVQYFRRNKFFLFLMIEIGQLSWPMCSQVSTNSLHNTEMLFSSRIGYLKMSCFFLVFFLNLIYIGNVFMSTFMTSLGKF